LEMWSSTLGISTCGSGTCVHVCSTEYKSKK
jgi:hypothetical protein